MTAIVLTQPLEKATRFLRLQRIASWLGGPLEPQSAFPFAVVGLGVGFVLDFVWIGITTLPLQLLVHRLGLMIALGLLAAGAARSDAEGAVLFGIGLLGWIVGLAMPLQVSVGYVERPGSRLFGVFSRSGGLLSVLVSLWDSDTVGTATRVPVSNWIGRWTLRFRYEYRL